MSPPYFRGIPVKGESNGLSAVFRPQFTQDATDVVLSGLGADEKPVCDFLIRHAASRKGKYFLFAAGKVQDAGVSCQPH